MGAKAKKIKIIKIDTEKCTGCLSCEAICSAFHDEHSLVNRKRSRIRVFIDEGNDLYVPIIAGQHTEAECPGRHITIIKDKEYDECSFCRSSCPSRDLFKEPDSEIPLRCDMCGEPPQPEPLCVKWCLSDALTYVEREEDVKEETEESEMESAISYLIDRYGLEEIQEILDRKSRESGSAKRGLKK